MKVSCMWRKGLRRPSLGKYPGGRRWARSLDRSSNGRSSGRGTGALARGGPVDSARGPRAGEGAWELGPGFSIQVTSRPGQTLEDTWDRGRGLAPGPWDPGQGRKFCTGPRAQPAANTPPPPPPPRRPPGPQLLLPPRGLSDCRPLGVLGSRLRPGGSLWAPRDEIRMRRPRRGPDPDGPRGPRSAAAAGRAGATEQPNGNPARLGTEAGGAGRRATNLGLAKDCHLAGRERLGGAASLRGSARGKVPRIRILRKWSG